MSVVNVHLNKLPVQFSVSVNENPDKLPDRSKAILLWWFFLFYVLVFKTFLCCWRLMCVFIVLVKLR